MPLVSVIMPSYNHERFIPEAIESVLGQTCSDIELIVVDDASSDGSRRIIEAYKSKDARIRTILHDSNMGIARTLNDGMKEATGEFISFIASDDVWALGKIERQLSVLRENNDYVVCSKAQVIDAQGNLLDQQWDDSAIARVKTSGDFFEDLLKGNLVIASSLIVKRSNLGNITFDEGLRYFNDYRFAVDLARKYNYYFVPEPLVKYRIHGANTSKDTIGYAKDTIVISKYFLSTYSHGISRGTRSNIYRNMATAHFDLGSRSRMLAYLWHASRSNPLDPAPLVCLVDLLTRHHRLVRRILSWVYHVPRSIMTSLRRETR